MSNTDKGAVGLIPALELASLTSADFIMKLLLVQGYDSILVVVDQFTKMAHFMPTTEKATAEGLARMFRDNM